MPKLPLRPEELAARLSRALPRRDGLELTVTAVRLVSVDGDLRLQMPVTVKTTADPRPQRWEVDLPIDAGMLDPDVLTSAFVLTIRANLEEWWDLRASEPDTAALARRID